MNQTKSIQQIIGTDPKLMDNIRDTVKMIYARGLLRGLTRHYYDDVGINKMLSVIEVTGKSRDPRFVIDEDNRFTYVNLVKWIVGDPTFQALNPESRKPEKGRLNAGIYIAGSTGTGKTWALEILAAVAGVCNFQYYNGEAWKPIQWANVRADTICEQFQKSGLVEVYKNRSILSIQDFGSEPTESVYMGNRLAVMRTIIESRADMDGKFTFITSNFPMSHDIIGQTYGDRVSSRLRQMCNYFEMRGKDRRL